MKNPNELSGQCTYNFLDLNANDAMFLISNSTCSPQILRKVIGFRIWTLHPALCYTCLLVSKFLGWFSWIFYPIMSSMDNFISSFPMCLLFISFPCLNALGRTSSTVLNRSGEKEHLCIIFDHTEWDSCDIIFKVLEFIDTFGGGSR